MARPREFDENDVLERAMALFWHKGYGAASIQELVETMGISRGSLYDTFGDKHSLFLAALDRYQQRSHDRFLDILNRPRPVKENFAELFQYILNQALADKKRRGCLITNSTVELTPHDSDIAARLIDNRQWVEERFVEVLTSAQANGELKPDADLQALAQFLFNSLQGLRVVSKTTSERQVLENIIRVTLSVLE